LVFSEIGKIANDFWKEIPAHYPFVEIDQFVVMPNHIHGILFFNRPDKKDWTPNKFGIQSQNLGAVIRAFKSSLKRYSNQNKIQFEWQSLYHDRIIRNDKALNAIRRYIINHPIKWKNDSFNRNDHR
jgi:REP element-mobilizing transposase RayT